MKRSLPGSATRIASYARMNGAKRRVEAKNFMSRVESALLEFIRKRCRCAVFVRAARDYNYFHFNLRKFRRL